MRKPKLFFSLFFGLLTVSVTAQQTVTLDQCYDWAKQNHPLSTKNDILNRQSELELQALEAQKYPRVDLDAQATYQSDVVSLPISLPNINIEKPDNDQYKANLTVSELIYNGGLIDTQKQLKTIQNSLQQKETDVQLHGLKYQINQVYFSILLNQQKNDILSRSIQQLQDKKTELEKLIATGSTYESVLQPVEIKLLEISQNIVELQAVKVQLFDQLSLLTGQKIAANTVLDSTPTQNLSEKPRPEIELFDLQKNLTGLQTDLLQKQILPKISAFGTIGYGKPGLNMLKNEFDDYYIAGIKLQWNVFDWNANKKQRQATEINQELIDNQKQVFEWGQQQQAQNYQSEIIKYNTLLKTDQEIIKYRKQIVITAEKQLKHDLITPSDYVAEVNNLLNAEITQKTHEIQLALAQANFKTTLYE